MAGKLRDPRKGKEEQGNIEELDNQAHVATQSSSNDRRQTAIKRLLKNMPVSVDDKLATVKTAHHVDRERFQNAFRSLMNAPKA